MRTFRRLLLAGLVCVLAACGAPVTETVDGTGQHVTAAFIGDSYTTGRAKTGGLGPKNWATLVCEAEGWTVANESVGGSGFTRVGRGETTFAERVPDVAKLDPQYVFVWGARNDEKPATAGAFNDAVTTTLQSLKSALPDATVVLIGPAWVDGDPPEKFVQFRDIEKEIAAGLHVPFIDPLAEGWFAGGEASLISNVDDIHPSDAGHRHIATLVLADLHKLGVVR